MVSLSRKQTNSPVTMMMISRFRSKYKSTCFTSTKVLAWLVARVNVMMSGPLETVPGARGRKVH